MDDEAVRVAVGLRLGLDLWFHITVGAALGWTPERSIVLFVKEPLGKYDTIRYDTVDLRALKS